MGEPSPEIPAGEPGGDWLNTGEERGSEMTLILLIMGSYK